MESMVKDIETMRLKTKMRVSPLVMELMDEFYDEQIETLTKFFNKHKK